jgi:hypothetical protein
MVNVLDLIVVKISQMSKFQSKKSKISDLNSGFMLDLFCNSTFDDVLFLIKVDSLNLDHFKIKRTFD